MRDTLGAIDPRVSMGNFAGAASGGGFSIGAYGSLPASGTSTGEVYQCTDVPYRFVWDGSQWQAFYYVWNVDLPPTSDWSWANQDGAVVDDGTYGFLTLIQSTSKTFDQMQCRVRSAPSTPWTLDVLLTVEHLPRGTLDGGLCLKDSASGRLIKVQFTYVSANYRIYISKMNDETSYNSYYRRWGATVEWSGLRMPVWFRITDDGTNLNFYDSPDKQAWSLKYGPVSRTNFLTNGPDQIGYFVNATSPTSGWQGTTTIFSWGTS